MCTLANEIILSTKIRRRLGNTLRLDSETPVLKAIRNYGAPTQDHQDTPSLFNTTISRRLTLPNHYHRQTPAFSKRQKSLDVGNSQGDLYTGDSVLGL